MGDHPTRGNDIEIVGTEVVDETITTEINDSDGKNYLSDEIQEEVSSNLLHLKTKWNSPGVLKRNKTSLSTPHCNLKTKLSQWSAQKTECGALQKEYLREEHEQKLRHNEERHHKYLQECNLRMQHMQEKHELELQLLKKSLELNKM
ncbi:hypothetical protein Zmor_027940 [Zophobas morio]|uniref:Uncharacterized protein n=1 Tax=Zophobas morio TaxID=2755281 RepID=A0AA38HP49_9CUCU|nr:hypothetical protein Zmor_027940 [Zophobas morio]